MQLIFDEKSRQFERVVQRQDTDNLVDQVFIYKRYIGDLFNDSSYQEVCNFLRSVSELASYFFCAEDSKLAVSKLSSTVLRRDVSC